MGDILIKIMPTNKEIRVKKGSILIDALYEHGYIVPSSCGRRGICGKCLVEIECIEKRSQELEGGKSRLR
ncbi:MAG: 2Fe-2S iron-sulfur cluster-binding protein, partial [Candidatus Hydrogenedens sp.]